MYYLFRFLILIVLIVSGVQFAVADCQSEGGRIIGEDCFCVRVQPGTSLMTDRVPKTPGMTCPLIWGIEFQFNIDSKINAEKLNSIRRKFKIKNPLTESEKIRIRVQNDGFGDDGGGLNYRVLSREEPWISEQLLDLWLKKMDAICTDRKLLDQGGELGNCEVDFVFKKVQYADGFYLNARADRRTITFALRALTQEEWQSTLIQSRIRMDIFYLTQEMKLSAHRGIASGSLYMDLPSHFQGDGELFTKFLLDYHNHPHLPRVLSKSIFRNPSVALLSVMQRDKFLEVLNTQVRKSPFDIAKKLNTLVFNDSPSRQQPPQMFQALGLSGTRQTQTMKIGELDIASDYTRVDLLMSLFSARLLFLKQHPVQNFSIAFDADDNSVLSKAITTSLEDYQATLESLLNEDKHYSLRIEEFYKYVTDAGLEWTQYENFIRTVIPDPRLAPILKKLKDSSTVRQE